MSAHPRNPPAMNPGGAAVGRLAELPPLEARIIRCVRLWSGGPQGRAALGDDLARWQGRGTEGVAGALDQLLELTVRHARRPLMGHALHCPCAGSDECVFARFVSLAAEGDREEAVLIAALIVRADVAFALTGLAERVGLGLMRGEPGTDLRRLQ
jgi:hypothetical protein